MTTQVKDPELKLFGKTIQLPETSQETLQVYSNQDPSCSSNSILDDCDLSGDAEEELDSQKNLSSPKQTHAKEEDQALDSTSEELNGSNVNPPINEDSKTVSIDSDDGATKTSKSEEDQSETSNSREKILKKPDKLLPCPRCNSMDTKFCYFNNYNVNQPRHFCKKCQRYWTAGGTMRNVPVGAGRRKNKNASAQFHSITGPEALQGPPVDLRNGIHHPGMNPNGTVLTFSSDASLPRNGLHQSEGLGISVSHGSRENGDDYSSGSSITAACSKDEIGKVRMQEFRPNCQPFQQQVPYFPMGPWPYPWSSPASFPIPFYPTGPPYWTCAIPGNWNVPWVLPSAQPDLPPRTGSNSSILGKHSRDDSVPNLANEKEDETRKENPEKCLWIPKTLRINDPREAAKSSIWSTLGIKNDHAKSIGGGGLFKAFNSKSKVDEMKMDDQNTSTVLEANPAALSRSLNFHERS